MILRKAALTKASGPVGENLRRDVRRNFSGTPSSKDSLLPKSPLGIHPNHGNGGGRAAVAQKSPYASISEAQKQKKDQDRDFLVSVLETSVTKRDARAYMKRFVPLLERKGAGFKQRNLKSGLAQAQTEYGKPLTAQDWTLAAAPSSGALSAPNTQNEVVDTAPLLVAIVKIRLPQDVNDATLAGVGKSLSQLKQLGLISIIVVDTDMAGKDEAEQRRIAITQANRLSTAVDSYELSGARVIESPIIIGDKSSEVNPSPFTSNELYVDNPHDLMKSLQEEIIPIIPAIGCTEGSYTMKLIDANAAVLALIRQLSGLQHIGSSNNDSATAELLKAAEVYRLIILDPIGGIPALNRATGRHMFLNLEQQFDEVQKELTDPNCKASNSTQHLRNAKLAKDSLSLLPPTSSALITTPQEAAKERIVEDDALEWPFVGTRRMNPLIHNLLTDKPVQSSSLPSGRIRPVTSASGGLRAGGLTTLAKRGMPLTIFPDPRVTPWRPPQPGEARLNLTDPSIDLSRLVYLIEDSFGRKLDVEHYLNRIHGNLAGVIIAGEYEGGALLTWEKPFHGDDSPETSHPSRLVPYLDKFAVLKKSQGAGGVADIVFNAMVRDCFPEGVCWRSRKDNPVNKWYFERSRGTVKIKDMNWTMFWTTPDLVLDSQRFRDYESICRQVEPSWADQKHIVD